MRHGRPTSATARAALAALAGLLAACGEEPPPTSVSQFLENPILLEATMVRCVQNRAEARYEPECINAREAVDRIAVQEERARRAELEAESERKRQALRRAQQAAAEARRRALEEERRRQEAELLGPFAPPEEGEAQPETDRPQEVPPPPSSDAPSADDEAPDDEAPPPDGEPSDLESIRQELERRQQDSG